MEEARITVLLVEDDADEVFLLTEAVRDAGAEHIAFVHAETQAEALEILRRQPVDAVLLDLSLPDSSGVGDVEAVVSSSGEAPVIVCTGLNDQSVAQAAIRAGAQDYLIKNPKLYGAVPRILRHTVERSRIIHAANKKMEQARSYTELMLTKVIAVAESGLAITDGSGKFLVVNPALAELRGCSCSDLLGRPWTDILPVGTRALELGAYLQSLESEADYNHQRLVIESEDGSTIEASMRSVPLQLGENRPCRVLSFGNPIAAKSSLDTASLDSDGVDSLFTDQLKKRVGDPPTRLAVGHVKVEGLQNQRAGHGGRWDQVAERVYEIAEEAIVRRVSPEDIFTRRPNGDFIICFDRASEPEAYSAVEAIVREIRHRILESGADDCFMDHDLRPAVRARLADVVSEAQSIQLAPSEVHGQTEITRIISEKIALSAARAKAAANAMLAEFRQSCRATLREAHRPDRGTTSLAMQDLDSASRPLSEKLIRAVHHDPAVVAEVDLIALGNTARKINDFGPVRPPLIAVDLHYSTLSDRKLSDKYLSVCRSLGRNATRALIFKIKDIPPDAHSAEVAAALSTLPPFSRFRMMQITRPSLGSVDLKAAKIALVVIDFSDLMSTSRQDPAQFRKLVEQVHLNGARIGIDRVASADSEDLFNDLNIDFFCYDQAIAQAA